MSARLDSYLTIAQAAKKLGIGYSMMARYAAHGCIPSIRVGNMRLIHAKDLRKFKRNPVGNPNFISRKSRR